MTNILDKLTPKNSARLKKIKEFSDISEKLKSLRSERGLTQVELSLKLVCCCSIRKLEQGIYLKFKHRNEAS